MLLSVETKLNAFRSESRGKNGKIPMKPFKLLISLLSVAWWYVILISRRLVQISCYDINFQRP